jgi:hypothetical protein
MAVQESQRAYEEQLVHGVVSRSIEEDTQIAVAEESVNTALEHILQESVEQDNVRRATQNSEFINNPMRRQTPMGQAVEELALKVTRETHEDPNFSVLGARSIDQRKYRCAYSAADISIVAAHLCVVFLQSVPARRCDRQSSQA